MKFKKRLITEAGLRQIDIAPLIDCVFLLLIFFLLTSSFIVMPAINIKFPKAATSEKMNTQALMLLISSEDIIYLEGEPLTLKELEKVIEKNKYNSVSLRADREASLGIVVGVWDICKQKGVEKISIATTEEE